MMWEIPVILPTFVSACTHAQVWMCVRAVLSVEQVQPQPVPHLHLPLLPYYHILQRHAGSQTHHFGSHEQDIWNSSHLTTPLQSNDLIT